MRARLRIALLLLAGCAGAPQPSEPVASRSAEPSPPEAPPRVASPEAAGFLEPGFEAPTLTLVRVRDGAVRASADGEPVNAPTDRALLMRYPVLDADVDGDPSRPRILCDEDVRVALHLDVESLALVTGADAVLRAGPQASGARDTPGVYFDPGVQVESVGAEGAMARVRYSGLLLEAEGFVRASELTYAYEPRERDESGTFTAELPRGATFLDAPAGGPVAGGTVAVLEPYPNGSQRHLARTLGPAERGHRLVRYAADDLVIIGWVRDADVVDVSVSPGTVGHGYGRGGLGAGFRQPVDLPAGTRLLAAPGGEVIGRLESGGRFECEEACASSAPRVFVSTCVGLVRLWTAAP